MKIKKGLKMNFTKINRRKAGMLLHEMEASLGRYVAERSSSSENFPENTVNEIMLRNSNVDKSKISELLEETYLREVFDFALSVTNNTSVNKDINALMNMFIEYDVFKIRNIIAHSNRVFRDEYWYKLATIASSSLIEIIGLDGIKKTLLSAESGTIYDPPEDWLAEMQESIIPNNLPTKFEHAITGLVGRTSEEKELLKLLKNSRLNTIGVIASGGIGKTALVLELLNKLLLLEDTVEWCDGVIFIDMKTEKLTPTGVETKKAVETMEEVKNFIVTYVNDLYNSSFKSLDEVFEEYENKKLLIFIDNLETLIRDNTQLFEEFSQSLPRDWRLLVTSRVTISATIISLKALDKKSSVHLARMYVSKSGETALEENRYKSLVESCHYNPLAIRLTLDLYISGYELPKSIEQSTKMISNFSFENLIEKLSENAIKVLEALYVDFNIDRYQLGILLNLNIDEISESVSELSRTSLITRNNKNNKEFLNLSSSVRELLLSSPRNIEIRGLIQDEINKNKVHSREIDKKQKIEGIDEYHLKYIPNDIDPHLKILIDKLNASFIGHKLKKNQRNLISEFNSVSDNYKNEYMYHRSMGRLLYGLRDINGAIKSYKEALRLNNLDYMSQFLLAKTYFYDEKNYKLASDNYYHIIQSKIIGNNEWFAKTVLTGYFLSLLYEGEYKQVLKDTESWENNSEEFLIGVLGTYRASAWRRKLETIPPKNISEISKTINKSIGVFDTLFKTVGYLDDTCIQVLKLFDEISRYVSVKAYKDQDKIVWLEFISRHIVQISKNYNKLEDDYISNLISKFLRIKVKNNIFRNQKWKDYIKHNFKDAISEKYATENNYMLVNVTYIPKSEYEFPSFIFSENDKKESFLVHFSTLVSNNWNDWKSIEIGKVLAIQAQYADDRNKYKSLETQFVN